MTRFEIKEIHRQITLEIRNKKSLRKPLRGYVPGLIELQAEFRHRHIAYCILRGRTLDRIEPKRATEPSQVLIQKYLDQYSEVSNVA